MVSLINHKVARENKNKNKSNNRKVYFTISVISFLSLIGGFMI